MEKCSVCEGDVISEFADGLRRCSSCYWPAYSTAGSHRSAIDDALLGWAKNVYDQYVRPHDAPLPSMVAEPSIDPAAIQAISDKVDRLTEFCRKLQEARSEDRKDYDHRLTALMEESRFLRDAIGYSQSTAARVTAIEEWCQRAYQDSVEPPQSDTVTTSVISESDDEH
jgi:hypothetical protein